ncbi:MAG: hypothetical protein HXM47_02310 [Pseudoleptotrichia goodfellowii]|nr:hypothetical protein [Pseudoleptotrichia goodfellowii]
MKINIWTLDIFYKDMEYENTIDFFKKAVESGKCIKVKGTKEFYINSDYIVAFEESENNGK